MKIPLFLCILLFFSTHALAWKPVTHVYLAQQAIDSIEETSDDDGNLIYTLPIHYVNYETGEIGEKIDDFKVNRELLDAIRENEEIFYAGILGPDAYPDIVTGQIRIHPDDDGIATDKWLQYLWKEALASDDVEIQIFVRGFLNHAAGDMFMHTYVNHYAGGAFAFIDNGARHMVLETYIAKRTPELQPASRFNITLSQNIKNFIYEKMIDARQGTELREQLLDIISGEEKLNTSFPLRFSVLRDWLDNEIDTYLFVVDAYQTAYDNKLAEAIACGFSFFPPCAPIYAEAALILGEKQGYITLSFAQHEYLKGWKNNVINGLKAWPQFSHDIALQLSFNPEGMDRNELKQIGVRYFNEYLLGMLGAPDFAGELLQDIIDIRDLFFGDFEEFLTLTQDQVIDFMLRTAFGFGVEDAEKYFKNPELHFDSIMNTAKIDESHARDPIPITLATVNGQLRLQDDGYDDPDERYDPLLFEPAYNTLLMTKLLLLDKPELQRLYAHLNCLGNNCNDVENAMLGFIRTLDGDNEWHIRNPQMTLGHCQVFRAIFKKQIGEYETEFEKIPGNCLEPKLDEISQITPPSGSYATTQTISISHADPEAEIYYTINEAGQVHQPSNNPSNNRSRLYTEPFKLSAPFVGEIRPLVIAARAYKSRMQASDVTQVEYTITSQVETPQLVISGNEPYISNIDIGFTQPDEKNIYYTLNGQTPHYTSSQYTTPVTLSVGTHNVKAIAYKIGFSQSAILNKTIKVFDADTSRPMSPAFSPSGSGDYTTAITFELKTQTDNAEIYYTLNEGGIPENPDANQPSNNALLYDGPVTIAQTGNWFIRARTYHNDFVIPSEISQINYDIVEPLGKVLLPNITPAGGSFNNAVDVTITAETDIGGQSNSGIKIFHTTDGTTPIILPTEPANASIDFQINSTSIIKAKAYRKFFTASGQTEFEFRFETAAPSFTPMAGEYVDFLQITLASDTFDADIRYTTDGSEPNIESELYTSPINISQTTTLTARAFKTGYFFSETVSSTYQLRPSIPPVITQSPVSNEVFTGEVVSFFAFANSWPVANYEWRHNGLPMSGENQNNITISNVNAFNAGNYQVIVSNDFGTDTSDIAILTVLKKPELPVIIRQPISNEVDLSGSIALSIGIDDQGEKTSIIWYHNDNALPAKTGEVLNIPNVKTMNAGEYFAIASNAGGSITSERVMVDVILPVVEPAELDLNEPNEKTTEQDGENTTGGGCTINPNAKPNMGNYILLIGLMGFFFVRRRYHQGKKK